jgi:tyrosine-protein kinase Etk/Wzc
MALSENAELEELIRKATGETAGQLPPTAGPTLVDDQDDPAGGLDLSTLVLVARRSLIWVILLLALGFTGSWLVLRYTKPIYKSASLLKLDERSEAANLGLDALKGDASRPGNQLAGEVELIKSGITYQHLKERLALDVNYYVQGTVLENELYNVAPFRIQYKVTDPGLYGRKIQVSFLSQTQYALEIKLPDRNISGTYTVGQWADLPGLKLLLQPAPNNTLPVGSEPQYHFIILDDGAINGYLDKNLEVAVINPSANTIQISFTDNNPTKAAHIVNNIDTVYLKEKLARKKQSNDSTLSYIDKIIAENAKNLNKAEDNQQNFVRENKTYDIKSEVGEIKTRLEQQKEERSKLEQRLRLLSDVSTIMAREQLTRSDDESVADNIPGLEGVEDATLVGLLNDLDYQQRALRLTLKSQTDKTVATPPATPGPAVIAKSVESLEST